MSGITYNAVLNGYVRRVAAPRTNLPISEVIKLENLDRLNLSILVTATVCPGTATVALQHSPDGVRWLNVHATDATITFTAPGSVPLFISPARPNARSYLPLFPMIRLVATTTTTIIHFSEIFISFNS